MRSPLQVRQHIGCTGSSSPAQPRLLCTLPSCCQANKLSVSQRNRRVRHNASQPKLRKRVANQRFCRFCSVSLSLVGGGKGIKEAEFCRVEVCSSVFVSRAQSGQLPERSETRHKATRSDDLLCLLQYNGPIAIGWLIEPGQRFVVQYRPLQPLLTLFACQHSLAAKIRCRQINIQQLVYGIQVIHGNGTDDQLF